MQSRVLPYATITAAVTAIALTALPWFDLKPLGLDVSWNGLGMSSDDALSHDLAPSGRGWLVIAACVVALLAALISLMPSPKARPVARLANVIAALTMLAGAAVPIAILIWPDWYYGDLVADIGATDLAGDLAPSLPVLLCLAVAMLLGAGFCAASSADRDPDETRITPARDERRRVH